MARTYTLAFPLLMNQPITGRIAEIRPDDTQRFTRNKTGLVEQTRALGGGERAGRGQRRNLRAPENLIRHPVSDSGESALQ
jgi:hypothetical protein